MKYKHTDKSRTKGIRHPGPTFFRGGGTFFRATGGVAVGGAGDMPLMVPAGGGPYGYYGGGPVETYVIPFSGHPAAERRTWNQYFGEGGGRSGGHPSPRGYGY